jgi:uncharacterized Zn finger protein (UPF0148 family)
MTFAATASAATVQQKEAAFKACMQEGSSLMKGNPSGTLAEACCDKAGGKVFQAKDGTIVCILESDLVAPTYSIRPQGDAIVIRL